MTAALSMALNLVLAAALIVLAVRYLRDWEARKQRRLLGPWPIPRVAVEAFDPAFTIGALGPGRETEIRFIAGYRVEGGVTDLETWILANLAKGAREIFEFGTATGKTAYLLAANAPEARITTLTLGPDDLAGYRAEPGDAADAVHSAASESRFTAFYYTGTPEAARITQLFADSKAFDEAPHRGRYDMVFVDGSHARSYVDNDSRKALAMVRPGGLVLWHDYRGPRRAPGVFQALGALSHEFELVHLAGTAPGAHRRPS